MKHQVLVMRAIPVGAIWTGLLLSTLLLLTVAPPTRAAPGALAWQRTYNGVGNGQDDFFVLAPAPNGGAYVAGDTQVMNRDFLAARYSSAGRRLWLHAYNGPGDGNDWLTAATSDASGNLVVAGYVTTPAATTVTAAIKYGPDGRRRWVRLHNVPTVIPDNPQAIAVDVHGNIYVASSEYGATSGWDIIVIKYSSSGTKKWVRRYAGPSSDVATDLGLDGSGNVYVTGYSYSAATDDDVLTMKFDPAGHRRWLRRWDGTAHLTDVGGPIVVTRAGSVYVGGSSYVMSAADALLLKYTTGGVLRWSRTYAGAGGDTDINNDVALLGNGDVATVGWVLAGAPTHADLLLARYSSGGTKRWTRLYNGPDSGNDQGVAVARDRAGAIFVAGTSTASATGGDVLTLKYSGSGALRWARRHSSAGTMSDWANALAVVGDSSVYVAGSQATATLTDGVLLRYKP